MIFSFTRFYVLFNCLICSFSCGSAFLIYGWGPSNQRSLWLAWGGAGGPWAHWGFPPKCLPEPVLVDISAVVPGWLSVALLGVPLFGVPSNQRSPRLPWEGAGGSLGPLGSLACSWGSSGELKTSPILADWFLSAVWAPMGGP